MRTSLAIALLVGCTSSSEPSDGGTDQDLAQYDALQQQLDAHRTQFLPTGTRTPAAVGHQLFWEDFGGNASPPLSRFDEQSGARVTYGFSIGDSTADTVNYRASANLVVTTDESNVYQVYAADQAEQSAGQFSMTPPSDEQKWWAYAVDGTSVYVLTTGSQTELLRWQVGDDAPTPLFALETAGVAVGELWDFDVAGNDAVIIESGAVWHVDLTTHTSVQVPAQNQLDPSQPISFDGTGILYTAQGGQNGDLLYYELASAKLTDVSAAIAASPYRINATFAQAHYYQSGGVLDGNVILYIGDQGLFTYDLATGKITPLLLSPNQLGLRIDYVQPQPLSSGDIYVVGLTSNDGAIGFEGPLYKVTP